MGDQLAVELPESETGTLSVTITNDLGNVITQQFQPGVQQLRHLLPYRVAVTDRELDEAATAELRAP